MKSNSRHIQLGLWGAVLFVVMGVVVGLQLKGSPTTSATPVSAPAAAAPALQAPSAPASQVPASGPAPSVTATARFSKVHIYATPGGSLPISTMASPNNFGAPVTFLVRQAQDGWLNVYMPVRPNDATAWIPQQEVSLSLDPYAVIISTSHHNVSVWHNRQLVMDTPAAVGAGNTPTPLGTFFVTELLRQPNARGPYGPYAFGLSAYSPVLLQFDGGPGQIGIHGTNDPNSVGTSASHGCIRLPNPVISHLASMLPLGTPVFITN